MNPEGKLKYRRRDSIAVSLFWPYLNEALASFGSRYTNGKPKLSSTIYLFFEL